MESAERRSAGLDVCYWLFVGAGRNVCMEARFFCIRAKRLVRVVSNADGDGFFVLRACVLSECWGNGIYGNILFGIV